MELKLETGTEAAPGGTTPSTTTTTKPRQVDATLVIPRGVSLDQLEKGGQSKGLASATAFSKKKDKTNMVFIVIGVVVTLVIIGLLLTAFFKVGSHN